MVQKVLNDPTALPSLPDESLRGGQATRFIMGGFRIDGTQDIKAGMAGRDKGIQSLLELKWIIVGTRISPCIDCRRRVIYNAAHPFEMFKCLVAVGQGNRDWFLRLLQPSEFFEDTVCVAEWEALLDLVAGGRRSSGLGWRPSEVCQGHYRLLLVMM